MTNTNNDTPYTSCSRLLTHFCVNEFEQNYPNLDVKKLTATFPASLQNVNISEKQMAQVALNEVTKSVICGTVFGDGNIAIQTGYANARIQYRHSTRSTEWFMWKTLCAFAQFTSENTIQFQKPDGFQRKTEAIGGETLGKWTVSTLVNDKLTEVHNILRPSSGSSEKKTYGPKEIKRSWLNHMSDYFLMTLWLDDGSLVDARQGVLATYAIPEKEVRVLAGYIDTVWGVKCAVVAHPSRVTSMNTPAYQINIKDLDNLQKFLRIIAPIVPVKSMLYKVCLYPEDVEILKRWTSELKTLVRPEFHGEINKYYAYLGVMKDVDGLVNIQPKATAPAKARRPRAPRSGPQ